MPSKPIKSLIYLLTATLLLTACAPKDGEKLLTDTKQDAKAYVKLPQKMVLISKTRQDKLRNDYLKHYYRPWSKTAKIDIKEIWKYQYDEYTDFFKHPGYGENKQPITIALLNSIKDNIQLGDIDKVRYRAITTRDTNIRRLPTDKPSFKNFNKPGDGYPFDRLQNSLLAANTPILVVAQSKDKAWSLVKCHFLTGWIKSSDLAYVDDEFIKQWRTKKYAVTTERRVPLIHKGEMFHSSARIGSILPVSSETKTNFTVLRAVSDQHRQAVIIKIPVSKKIMRAWPMVATASNFNKMINHMLGELYGWGGMYGYRDCSSTLQDLYASFGMWLPRSSFAQAEKGRFIKLDGLSANEKLAKIKKSGKPLMTLIDIHGHIMLYLGTKYHTAYVFQNMWGVHNRRIGRSDGRIIIGKAVITPIDMGEVFLDVKGKTALDKSYGMSVL